MKIVKNNIANEYLKSDVKKTDFKDKQISKEIPITKTEVSMSTKNIDNQNFSKSERINQIKQQISNGTFKVNPEKIVEKMLDNKDVMSFITSK